MAFPLCFSMTLDFIIRRIGNSLGVIIPTETLALLNVKEGDHLYLTEATEGSIRLSAQRPGFGEKAAIADDLIHDLPPLNGTTSRARFCQCHNQGRAFRATRKERTG